MPASELGEWEQYYSLQPFGAWRDNYHSAQIAQILFNANRSQHTPPAKMADFMYRDAETIRKQTEEQALAFFEQRSN